VVVLARQRVRRPRRLLLAASALGGALVLVSADLLARTAVANAELPLGMLTALVGGPSSSGCCGGHAAGREAGREACRTAVAVRW